MNWKCPKCGIINTSHVLCMNLRCDYETGFIKWSFTRSPFFGFIYLGIVILWVILLIK